jgi:hypothetical protein
MNAAQKYLARLYEWAIDANLDVEAIRLYLAARGIARSPAMIRHDLDVVYQFAGYSDSHQPAPAMSAQQWDAQIGRC